MAIEKRIRFHRNLRGITKKWLGQVIGFDEKTADAHNAQYESVTRTLKSDLTNSLANVLDVSPKVLVLPNIDSNIGVMHTFFALEDLSGIRISEANGTNCLKLNESDCKTYEKIHTMLSAWLEQAKKLEAKEEYDEWGYNYPKFDTTRKWAKVPSQRSSVFSLDSLEKGAQRK